MLPEPKSLRASLCIRGQSLVAALSLCALSLGIAPSAFSGESERFKDTEIRVIRPRFFTKARRFEVSAGTNLILNESFIYGVMLGGTATYHFSEDFALELGLSKGFSQDTRDKRTLFEEFEIKTQIFRTDMMAEAAIQWTPIYGKWQLSSGRLVYFDTYLTGGVGLNSIDWRYDDFCEPPDLAVDPTAEEVPANKIAAYRAFLFGMGQRYFLSRSSAFKIDVRFRRVLYNALDGECSPIKAASEQTFSDTEPHDTITLFLGYSFYF